MTRGGMPEQPGAEPNPDSLSEEAARNTLALNPLIGLRGKDLMDSAAILLKAMVNEPTVAGGQWLSFLSEIGRIGAGQSDRVQQPGDKRFADATWKNSGLHRQLLQAYLAWGDALNGFIDKTSLGEVDKARARFDCEYLHRRRFAHQHALEQSGRGAAVLRHRRRKSVARI